ncbi:MAG TPA: ATP-binding cassette domain-containing protein [Acidimicrobiales bacterium]|nr:ATP-binding cassette domain-containing protein [Acidimicrobiales bacterium]
MTSDPDQSVAVRLEGVAVVRGGRRLLDDVAWVVRRGERWVLLGPNGSGKTTLLQVAGARLWPTGGVVEILGHRLGRVDVRTLRGRVAVVSGAVIRQLRATLTAHEVVVTGRDGALEPWWHEYTSEEWGEADRLLDDAGTADLGDRAFGVISEGERQHVLLARALMSRPELLLLDEPAAGLDLGARERLVTQMGDLASAPDSAPIVLVTHHTEEIPAGITHAALIRQGRLLAAGTIGEILTSDAVSECFGVEVTVEQADGRWWSRARTGSPAGRIRTR